MAWLHFWNVPRAVSASGLEKIQQLDIKELGNSI